MTYFKYFKITMLLFSALSASAASANDREQMCHANAQRYYANCLAGNDGGGGVITPCRTQTRCESVCNQQRRLCRVFDCNGLIVSSYVESCLDTPQQFHCSSCYRAGTDPFSNSREQFCYKVYDTTDGGTELIDTFCTAYTYGARNECEAERGSDFRCGQ